MTLEEKLALIEAHREELLDAISEADRAAYRFPTHQYDVVLLPDGKIVEREFPAGSDKTFHRETVITIGHICHRGTNVMFDFIAHDELLDLLMDDMNTRQKDDFDDFCLDYEDANDGCSPSVIECLSFIKQRMYPLWYLVEQDILDYILSTEETEEEYKNLLDDAIVTLIYEDGLKIGWCE